MKKLVTAVVFLAVCLLLFSPTVVADPPWNPGGSTSGGGVTPQGGTDPGDEDPWGEIDKPAASGNWGDNGSAESFEKYFYSIWTAIKIWSISTILRYF